VAIGDLDGTAAARAAAALGGGAVGLALDVTDRDSFTRFLDRVETEFGPLDVLVNNAGIMPLGLFAEEDDRVTDRILAVNLGGVTTGSKLALKRMLPRRSGHIVNVASQVGRAGFAGAATYSASKHGVVGLSASLSEELEGSGVAVTCVMPAVVRTDMTVGVGSTRLIRPLGPGDVAAAIVRAVKRPRRNVHVPASAVITVLAALLPVRLRHAIERVLGARNLLLARDADARRGYEKEAAG